MKPQPIEGSEKNTVKAWGEKKIQYTFEGMTSYRCLQTFKEENFTVSFFNTVIQSPSDAIF